MKATPTARMPEIRWKLLLLASLACASLSCNEPEEQSNNGTTGFICGPKSSEKSDCHQSNFERPENGWCQGYRIETGSEDSPFDDEMIAVEDDEADTWICIECLKDEDCLPGSECAADGECGAIPDPESDAGNTSSDAGNTSSDAGNTGSDAGDDASS